MTDMEKAYKLATLAVRQRYAEQRPDDLRLLNQIRKGEVAAYTGSYDQAEEVFKLLNVPVSVNPDAGDLCAKIAFINCSREYEATLVEKIREYVEQGLWLVTSDWALHYILERNFPNTVRWTGRQSGTEIISVEPGLESLWSDIVVLGADPQWWLWGSYPIEILDRETVRIEAASHDLLVRYDAPVVAVRFAWGRGHVFHVISHFWAKSSATPTTRHTGPCTDFLRAGMRLSEAGIEKVMWDSRVTPDEVNFATIQSAVTATELIAQLCVGAMRAQGNPPPEGASGKDETGHRLLDQVTGFSKDRLKR